MPKLPVAPGADHVRVFKALGWVHERWSGSHNILSHPNTDVVLSVPCHNKDLPRGTLGGLVTAAGLTRDQYIAAFSGKK